MDWFNYLNLTIIEFLFWLLLLVCVGISVTIIYLLEKYQDKVKWVKRKSELLKCLLDDHDQLLKKQKQVELYVRSFWDIEDLSRIHLKLTKSEKEWVELTNDVLIKADRCCGEYHKQSSETNWSTITVIFRLYGIIFALREIHSTEKLLKECYEKKDIKAKNIHMSMERSRSKSRSLLDDTSVAAQNQNQNKPSPSFDELMNKNIELFSGMEERWSIYLVLALNAFLEDLSQLQLETETEKCWRKVAKEIVKDAENVISNFIWWLQTFGILKKFVPFFMSQFRKQMKLIVAEFNELLKYNVTFIDRAAEKSTIHSTKDDREIASAIETIKSKMKNLDASTEHALEKIHQQLQDAEETAGINAYVKQLKFIAQELDSFQEDVTEPELNQSEIRNDINLLDNLIETCSIKRQQSIKVVGLKNEEQELVSKLTTRSGSNDSTLSIVGMKGVGKTTLAKVVYCNKDVVEHFPVRVWVTVTVIEGEVNESKALMKMDGTKDQTLTLTEVCNHLTEKLCLVVLDNVSETKYFDKLHGLLSTSQWTNGSRIVLTTRFKDVAFHANNSTSSTSTPHHIRLLTKEESWTLFQKFVDNQIPPKKLDLKMEKFAKNVVGKCGGLPLAILSLGCVMLAKDITQENLSWVLEQINHGHDKTHWLQLWEKNKEELSKTMRDCLCYMTNFPVDYDIPARRLVNLWVGEGLVLQNNEKTLEGIAESYLEEFRDSNMIQVVALKSNGKIKTCRLPSMLREIILQSSNRTSHGQYLGTHLDRRFAYHFDDRGLDANSAQAFRKKGFPLSVLFFDKREGSKPGEHIEKILSTAIASERFLETRALDLECIFRPQLPKTLRKLNNLKYLSLRWTYLEELPSCICKLLELETLDLKHTCINYIPSSIWELKKLKKLYLPQNYRSKLEGKPRGNFNENLHTLLGVFLYGSYPLLGYLHRLKNLQKLKLAFQLKQEEQKTLAEKIVKLEQLHSLTLKSVDETGDPKKLEWISFLKLEKLSSLRLFGELGNKLDKKLLPKNLTDLTLSASKLSDESMPELQKLLKLKSLCFYADSFIETEMVCTSGGFKQLQVLRFWNLEKLKKWTVEEGAMPSLVEFEARSCINLAFPTGLKHLKTIRTIKLRKMPNQFGKDIQSLVNAEMSLVNVEIYGVED